MTLVYQAYSASDTTVCLYPSAPGGDLNQLRNRFKTADGVFFALNPVFGTPRQGYMAIKLSGAGYVAYKVYINVHIPHWQKVSIASGWLHSNLLEVCNHCVLAVDPPPFCLRFDPPWSTFSHQSPNRQPYVSQATQELGSRQRPPYHDR